MKFGIRRPSIRGRVAARTSVKRYVRHSLGLKAPRGWGWVTNPRKALYNRVYNRTSFSIDRILKGCFPCCGLFALGGIVLLILLIA